MSKNNKIPNSEGYCIQLLRTTHNLYFNPLLEDVVPVPYITRDVEDAKMYHEVAHKKFPSWKFSIQLIID